jgi:hemerythrin-like domain-containing protein
MKPIGPLMWEHRRIDRMISLLITEIDRLKKGREVDITFLESAVDFMIMYIDRTHHGKEENILFRELAVKKLSSSHRQTMNELIEEHKIARNIVSQLVTAKESFTGGHSEAVADIITQLTRLSDLYPKHIEKEDKHFFFPILEYFTEGEQQQILKEFDEYDKSLIHEKYEKLLEKFEREMQDTH